jgi:hypothetical protein
MRLVHVVDGKIVELNYMWLPTWIGQNAKLKKEMEEHIGPKIVGWELTEQNLDKIHDMVLDYIVEKFPIPGLFDYLDGLKFVNDGEKSA